MDNKKEIIDMNVKRNNIILDILTEYKENGLTDYLNKLVKEEWKLRAKIKLMIGEFIEDDIEVERWFNMNLPRPYEVSYKVVKGNNQRLLRKSDGYFDDYVEESVEDIEEQGELKLEKAQDIDMSSFYDMVEREKHLTGGVDDE